MSTHKKLSKAVVAAEPFATAQPRVVLDTQIPGLALLVVRTVALKAVARQDRPHFASEVRRLGGARRVGERDEGKRQDRQGDADRRISTTKGYGKSRIHRVAPSKASRD